MMKVICSGLLAFALATMPMAVGALTFKKGQVLGADGQLYDGASPELQTRLIREAEEGGKSAGLSGSQLFVVVSGTITFVPLSDIAGKSEETVKEIVVEKVTATVTDALTKQALAQSGIEVENLADEAAEAASDEEVAAALETIEAADVAGIAASEAAEATKEAWANISQDDLAEATAAAAEFAAEEAAKVIEHQNIEGALQDLIDSGASEEDIAAFEAANPAPE